MAFLEWPDPPVAQGIAQWYDALMATKEVPTFTDEDWGDITAKPAERLKARPVKPVPPAIVRHAQRSYEGVPHPDDENKTVHVLTHTFDSEEKAEAFAKHMKNAGDHTTPPTSVSVAVDPDGTGDKKTVAWRAGKRRGRGAATA